MPTQVEIGQAGERIVARELAGKGYQTNIDTKAPGSTDIEARATTASLLVQVKAAMAPNTPASLSSGEESNIKSRASKLRWQAWEARVQVDAKLAAAGAVAWRQLA